jgi:hypothetical protein
MREFLNIVRMLSEGHNLTPGVIDGTAERVFSYGGCGALAIAIHHATGWPIVAVTDAHNVYDGRAGGGSAMHWLVQHSSGKLLDIDGLHDPEEMVERYRYDADDEEAAVGIASLADAMEWYEEGSAGVPLELAATFVEPLLQKL